MKKAYTIVIILFVALIALSNTLYTVDQTRYAIVVQFGEPVDVKSVPGLHAKIPFIQKVIYLDNRLMEYDVDNTIIYTKDKKNMVVNAYVRWRISPTKEDVLAFYKSFKSDSTISITEDAKRRLGDVIIGELKSELGLHVMSDVISQSRGTIMESVTLGSNRKLMTDGSSSGLTVIDVRIKRADLPPENQKSVYDRMKAERDQQAKKYRSEGQMEGQKIIAEADRKKAKLLAEANRVSQEIRGQADAEAAGIYAEAYNQDPEFYSFYRSLESYQTAFENGGGTLVLTPKDDNYFKYFGRDKGVKP